MHQNEIKVTKENISQLMKEAVILGTTHVAALLEQIGRQDETVLDVLKENTMSLEGLTNRLNTI